jgi:ABC-2 type transport system permease protein
MSAPDPICLKGEQPGIPHRSTEVRVVSARVNLRRRLLEIWRYRELLVGLTRKELKVRYKNSVLGFLWSMLNPATVLVVYFVVFGVILKNGIPYFGIYLVSGILVWNLIATALPFGCGSVVGNAGIVKKVAFPREVLPLSAVGSALVHFFLQSIVVVLFLVAFDRGPAIQYVPLLFPALLALIVVAATLTVLLSAINVRFRDTQHLLEIALVVWFFATPIVYQYRLVVDKVAHGSQLSHILFIIYRLNPVLPIVLTFQRAIYGVTSPVSGAGTRVAILPDHAGPWWYLWQLLVVLAVGSFMFAIAMKLFGRMERDFGEEL